MEIIFLYSKVPSVKNVPSPEQWGFMPLVLWSLGIHLTNHEFLCKLIPIPLLRRYFLIKLETTVSLAASQSLPPSFNPEFLTLPVLQVEDDACMYVRQTTTIPKF